MADHLATAEVGEGAGAQAGPEALRAAARELQVLEAALRKYATARIDSYRARLVSAALKTALLMILLVMVLAVAGAGAVLTVIGIGQSLAVAFGGRAWAGNLTAGSVLVLITVLGSYLLIRIQGKRNYRNAVAKYES